MQENILFVGTLYGEILQFELPLEPVNYTKISFRLFIEPKMKRFTTCKAQIRRDIKINEIQAKKDKKLEKKRAELAAIKAANPGLEIDEEQFLRKFFSSSIYSFKFQLFLSTL